MRMANGTARRLMAVAAEGVASGTPYMVGTKLLQGWLTATGVPLGLIGLLAYAELPYTLKMLWAPALDRWPIPWPDRRRGWLLLLQLLLVGVIGAMSLLRPGPEPAKLTAIGVMALVLAVVSATQDIVVDAYRTDLLPEAERGAGAAATNLGYRAAMLAIGAGGFIVAGRTGWPLAFLGSAVLMLLVVPFTLTAPQLPPIQHQVSSLRQAMVGPAREFLHRTGRGRAAMLLALVLLPNILPYHLDYTFYITDWHNRWYLNHQVSDLTRMYTAHAIQLWSYQIPLIYMQRKLRRFGK